MNNSEARILPGRTSRSRLRTLVAISAIAALATVLSGCSIVDSIFPAQASRSAHTGKVTSSGQSAVTTLETGDCFDDSIKTGKGGTVSDVTLIPCGKLHDKEAYAVIPLGVDTYPGASEVRKRAISVCNAAFATYVGIPITKSSLSIGWLTPTEENWSADDNSVTCLVELWAGDNVKPVVGSLKGTHR
jgi:hypothetical protein